MALATCELIRLKQCNEGLKFDVEIVRLICDNQATFSIASNLVFYD